MKNNLFISFATIIILFLISESFVRFFFPQDLQRFWVYHEPKYGLPINKKNHKHNLHRFKSHKATYTFGKYHNRVTIKNFDNSKSNTKTREKAINDLTSILNNLENDKGENIIIKGDVDGSIEALSDALLNLSTKEIQVNIIHKGVGAISEADVNLASASDAIILGFQVRPTIGARKLAENEQIDIRLYSIIYKAIEEIKAAMEGMLSPDIEENIIGSAEIRETFDITKVGTIAGCYVLEGIIKRNSNIRIIRDGIVVHSGELGSLKRFKDDVKEVKNNYECGLNIDKYNDIQVGDIVEAYEEVEVARKL